MACPNCICWKDMSDTVKTALAPVSPMIVGVAAFKNEVKHSK